MVMRGFLPIWHQARELRREVCDLLSGPYGNYEIGPERLDRLPRFFRLIDEGLNRPPHMVWVSRTASRNASRSVECIAQAIRKGR
jgi:hypothetical protein